jgi:hypothetical protein
MKQDTPTLTCEGECEEHIGALKRVNVIHPEHDWGEFIYCESAIEEDISRGLIVKILEE